MPSDYQGKRLCVHQERPQFQSKILARKKYLVDNAVFEANKRVADKQAKLTALLEEAKVRPRLCAAQPLAAHVSSWGGGGRGGA